MAERTPAEVVDRATAAGELIFMGPPGVGKGTQAKLLTDRHGWVQLSTGELFRDHIRRGSALGKMAQAFMDKGEYVPDDVTVGMVREFVAEMTRDARVMFDGFPRTVAQAEALAALLAERGRAIGRVVLMDVPRDELTRRILARSRAQGRVDDSLELLSKRFDVYERQTQPVIDHYERQGVVRRVNGQGSVDEVGARLAEATR